MIPCILFASLLLLHSLFPVGSSTRLEPAGDCKDPRYPPPTRGSLGAAFSPEELDAAQNTALEKHNYYRGLHDTPPLTISVLSALSFVQIFEYFCANSLRIFCKLTFLHFRMTPSTRNTYCQNLPKLPHSVT